MNGRVICMVALAGVLTAAAPALAGSGAGISGSTHDFSAETWNVDHELCNVCHVPHDNNRSATLFADGLLWNHQLSAATYRMYSEEAAVSQTFANHIDGAFDNEPTGGSKLCLGCHDGTIALDQFGANVNVPGGTTIGAGSQVPGPNVADVGGEKNLLGTHPVSIVYDETVDTTLRARTDAMGNSGTIQDVLELTAAGPKLQCASCHDVHDSPGESVPGTALLRVSQTTPPSGLCLTCHNK